MVIEAEGGATVDAVAGRVGSAWRTPEGWVLYDNRAQRARLSDVVATPDVIPAKAGIQGNRRTPGQVWIPAYAGMTPCKFAT